MGIKKNLRKKVGVFFLGMGSIVLIYHFVAKARGVTFSHFFFPFGAMLVSAGLVKLFLKPFKSKILRISARILHVILFLGIISIVIIESFIISSVFDKNKRKSDYVVILGAGLWGDRPSLILQQRLEASIDFIKMYPDIRIVVSGGQGPGETITEAAAMKNFLVLKGIEEKRIMIEDKSTSTLENLNFSREIIRRVDNRQNIKITIITSNFHMFRAKFLARRVGFIPYGYTAPIPYYLVPAYYIREYMAVIKSAVFDTPREAPAVDIGVQTDSYKGVPVYNNGKDYGRNYGQSYSKDGYYYGYKWQCVEYVKRFYYDVKKHKMPNVYGHAKDFFDSKLAQGEYNSARGLHQYKNGGDVKPEQDDLLVFNDSTYGHVAIVTEVGKDYIEIIQQNIYNTPRQKLSLSVKDGRYTVGTTRKPAGWLRK